ncbi:BZ3500_MvSof-1268-A1-R1_Chr5-2g08035 [Microbotryum saponariae]|uniref:BZ3500_MvSof-1268-A1-R1_Chr5-2g08035 protein n=1 Tax=Microbotryum saponariae TaxID=289078 RepID=A0A2X0LFW8_9BASI|nr:BZ3500_MvSof-1268-A1-R1_Chr5-2g08035 [Microbotryum saponariae]SDA05904.1 BZ3501_MvSof-1269-A2-R1_Chr5-2g07857 [Microbotryum saponariae]
MTARVTHHARIIIAVTLLLSCITLTSAKIMQEKRALPLPGATYDYVVIGAGTAGATIAARLAEDPSVTVAVIEAGDGLQDINPLAFMPGGDVLGVGADPSDKQILNDWAPITQPQRGASNRRLHYARGKGVGGSTIKNFMIYQRPDKSSFDAWEQATAGQDSPGWTWEDVYPYFTKSVVITPANNQKRGAQYTPRYNPAAFPQTDSSKAPLTLGYANFAFEYGTTLAAAYDELGYPAASDFSSGTLNGYAYNPSTIDASNGHRATSQKFIKNAQNEGLSNLKVITNAMVKKINFDSQMNGEWCTKMWVPSAHFDQSSTCGGPCAAVSCTYTTLLGAFQTTVSARREIILSAGAFQSPQLLMLSGIGPKAQLSKFGINQLVDLPGVGQNLQDHVFFSPGYEIKNHIYNLGGETQLFKLLLAGGSALLTNSGSLTNPVADHLNWGRFNDSFFQAHPEAAALSDTSQYGSLWPHYEFLAAPGLTQDFSNLFTLNSALAAQSPPRFFYSLLGALVAPLSRGTVSLASADSSVYPNIDPNWITHPGDQAVAIEIFKKIRRIFNTKAFRAVRANNQEYYPGLDVQSDADILKTIQASVQTVWHAACTCAMGARSKGGVLDPYLRVHGVNRLRVVDASSFPMLPPGHPQSSIYMLAERAADFITATRTGAAITPPSVTMPEGDSGSPFMGN